MENFPDPDDEKYLKYPPKRHDYPAMQPPEQWPIPEIKRGNKSDKEKEKEKDDDSINDEELI